VLEAAIRAGRGQQRALAGTRRDEAAGQAAAASMGEDTGLRRLCRRERSYRAGLTNNESECCRHRYAEVTRPDCLFNAQTIHRVQSQRRGIQRRRYRRLWRSLNLGSCGLARALAAPPKSRTMQASYVDDTPYRMRRQVGERDYLVVVAVEVVVVIMIRKELHPS
jgi:hypothetical protein